MASASRLTRAERRELRATTPVQAAARTAVQQGGIASFRDSETESIFHGRTGHTSALKRLDSSLWPVAQRKLDMLAAAESPLELRAVKGNHYEKMRSKQLEGCDSIRINEQFRIVFRYRGERFHDVQVLDYH